MTTTRMRLRSTTQDQLLGTSNLARMLSHIHATNTLYAHNLGLSTLHEDLPRGQALSDNTPTHNTHHTTSYLLATKLIMMKPYAPASPLFFLPPRQSEVFLSQANLVPHRPPHPAASSLRPSAWYPNQ